MYSNIFFMDLLVFLIAKRLKRDSEKGNTKELPTSYQLGLLILALNGGVGALWKCAKYVAQRELKKTVRASFWSLTIINTLTYVPVSRPDIHSALIILSDAWLHIVTAITQREQLSLPCYSPNSIERTTVKELNLEWSTYEPRNNDETVNNTVVQYETLSNIFTTNQLITATHQGQTLVLLGDKQASLCLDFSASTLAVNTGCTSITSHCLSPNAHFLTILLVEIYIPDETFGPVLLAIGNI